MALMNYRRFRLQTLENLNDDDASPRALRSARMIMEQALEEAGPRAAINVAAQRLEKSNQR